MKIPYRHIAKYLPSEHSIEELSNHLFQLGHEHELENEIFNFELTPNRGDCFSLNGILRELNCFYKLNINKDLYKENIRSFELDFVNNSIENCPYISFLKIEIENTPEEYKGDLADYFDDLYLKKNNFFTDISNYISYETGQPTHCYDLKTLGNKITLDVLDKEISFETLLNKTIKLAGSNLIFSDNNGMINLAGIVGGSKTACKNDTKQVLIECAYFNPEAIISKSIRYDIKSDAAHKFERGVDCQSHDYVLRRFLKIVESHALIKNIEIFKFEDSKFKNKEIQFDYQNINNILGTNFTSKETLDYLSKLGFINFEDKIIVPSYRNDIETENDLAEEIARLFGYDNIPKKELNIHSISNKKNNFEDKIHQLLINNGFFEVINNPFVPINNKNSIEVDNPLDSNRRYIRTELKHSLVNNLLYNERRQKDSIKLYEISNVYFNESSKESKRLLGIIASGRVGKNYNDFSKKIDEKYLKNILINHIPIEKIFIEEIDRKTLDTKIRTKIIYIEIETDTIQKNGDTSNSIIVDHNKPSFKKYELISEFPSSFRDISYLIKDLTKYKMLEEYVFNFTDPLLKEVFIFDFYNKNDLELKVGFRLVFQSKIKTITENEINAVINEIINQTTNIDSVSIPGISK